MSIDSNLTLTKYSPNYTFIFPFEKNHDASVSRQWMRKNWSVSFYIAIGYLVIILIGRFYMKNRQPINVRTVLVAWNFALAIFSLLGSIRTVPELIYALNEHGLDYSICNKSFINDKIVAFWGWMFVASKAIELFDTAFVVARKQKLNLIHWFHHAVTLCICWAVYHEAPANARWMASMNYSIHAVMYTYFALRAMSVKVPRIVAMMITTSQIAQMVMGLVSAIYASWVLANGGKCDMTPRSLGAILFGYGTFFALFVNFFLKTYIFVDRSKVKKA